MLAVVHVAVLYVCTRTSMSKTGQKTKTEEDRKDVLGRVRVMLDEPNQILARLG